MDARKRIIARCASPLPNGRIGVDFGGLVLRLILFDKLILHSILLQEIPALVRKFGYEPVLELLSSGAMDVYSDALTVGNVGHIPMGRRLGKGVLPHGSYAFSIMRDADRRKYIEHGLQFIDSSENINTKQAASLKSKLIPRLLNPLDSRATDAMMENMNSDLASNGEHIRTAVALALEEKVHTEVAASNFSLRIHRIDEEHVRTETDIAEVFNLSDQEVHQVVERGLLAVGGLNQRFAEMKTYTAISGFKGAELPIFEKKMDFLSTTVFPEAEAQVGRMKRVLSIGGFDELDEQIASGKVDLIKVLEIRDTAECREFRDWLWSAGSYTDDEIGERANSLRDKLSWFARGTGGKTLRWVASTGIDIGTGGVASAISGALDTFLLDKVLPNPGPLSFINNLYPTIFVSQPPMSWAEGFAER